MRTRTTAPVSTLGATVLLNADGTVTYDPDGASAAISGLQPGQSVVDTFTYTITDSNGQVSTATVSVTVTGELVVVTPNSGLTTTEAG